MSQVKNLRAMFEQKHDTSPPENAASDDRGRSPVESSTGASTPSARPLSKVRTSFVAIQEKDGRLGLRRDPSSDSVPTTRSTSQQRRLSSNTEESATNMATAPEPIPESPRQPASKASDANGSNGVNGSNGDASATLGAVTNAPSHNPDKQVDEETSTPKLRPADPTETPATASLPATRDDSTKTMKSSVTKEAPKPASKAPAKPDPASARPATKAPAKSPSLVRKPSNITKSASGPLPTRPAREPTREPTKKTTTADKTAASRPSATSTRTATKPTASSATKTAVPPVRIPASSSTGFVKPKPRSPTRPVNVPSSLMAGTASSQSKTKDGPRDSISRQSLGRSPSRASASTAGAGASTSATKTVKRQKSTIGHTRPSLGPPPKKPAQDHPVTKPPERDVDEGFLARMARPTLSSASKVNDKAPVTPPRRGATSTTRASSTATSTRKAPRPSSSAAQVVTGSPGPKGTTPQKLNAHEADAEPSAVEKAEVEEALRDATKIPEIAESVEPLAPEGAAVSETTGVRTVAEPGQPKLEESPIEDVKEPGLEPVAAAEVKATEEKEDSPALVSPAVEAAITEQETVPPVEEPVAVEPPAIEDEVAVAENAQSEQEQEQGQEQEAHQQLHQDSESAPTKEAEEEHVDGPTKDPATEEGDEIIGESAPKADMIETKTDDASGPSAEPNADENAQPQETETEAEVEAQTKPSTTEN